MNSAKAKAMRNRKHLRIVRESDEPQEFTPSQKEQIETAIDEMVGSICATNPLNPKSLKVTFYQVINTLFTKSRKKEDILTFLTTLSINPPEVIYNSIASFSLHLVSSGKKTTSMGYFWGFVRNNMFRYKAELDTNKKKKFKPGNLPDDFK